MDSIPTFESEKFNCPHCVVLSQQKWFDNRKLSSIVKYIYEHMFLIYRGTIQDFQQEAISSFLRHVNNEFPQDFPNLLQTSISIAECQSCKDFSIWIDGEIVYPKNTSVDPPNEDLNDEIKSLYIEASNILSESPKGSTALLRLGLQKFLVQVGKEGKNINNDIKELIEEGLSPKIQKALDLLRVIGNNAVHPGQINLDDNSEIAFKLFKVLNFIADELISKPKEIATLYDDIIPEETKKHINQRDGKTS